MILLPSFGNRCVAILRRSVVRSTSPRRSAVVRRDADHLRRLRAVASDVCGRRIDHWLSTST